MVVQPSCRLSGTRPDPSCAVWFCLIAQAVIQAVVIFRGTPTRRALLDPLGIEGSTDDEFEDSLNIHAVDSFSSLVFASQCGNANGSNLACLVLVSSGSAKCDQFREIFIKTSGIIPNVLRSVTKKATQRGHVMQQHMAYRHLFFATADRHNNGVTSSGPINTLYGLAMHVEVGYLADRLGGSISSSCRSNRCNCTLCKRCDRCHRLFHTIDV